MTLDLDRLEALDRAATPPPWQWDARSVVGADDGPRKPCGNIYAERDGEQVPIIVTDGGYYPPDVPDGEFILAAREALPQLLHIARAAQAHAAAVAKMDLPGYLSKGDTTDKEIAATDAALSAALTGQPSSP